MARLNQSIVIPDNTRLEKSNEFADSEIESIQIGQSVEISGDYVFARCNNVRELVIPSETILSGYGIFYCSNGLQNLRINDNVQLTGNYIFQDCQLLETIYIGNSINIQGNSMFCRLHNLQRIQFSPNTTFSGYYLFTECDNIREITIPDNCTINGDFFFSRCTGLLRITIGNNVVIRGSSCFFNCSNIQSITIGNNVTISGLRFLEGCFVNQNVELTIGNNYVGHPIHIPMPILHIEKFSDIKDRLCYEEKKCAISMEDFEDDSNVIVLKCGHVFLLEHMQNWLEIKKSCPTCRQKI